MKTIIDRICPECKKSFKIFKGIKKICCGRPCAMLKRSKDFTPYNKKEKVLTKCKFCNEDFKTDQWRINQGKSIFCSKEHHREWWKINMRGDKGIGWRGGPIKRICHHCGKEFHTRKCYVQNGGGIFCCAKCSSDWRIINFRGEKNPCWRGGTSSFQTLIRGSIKYTQWRNDVFKRDKFICKKCGSNSGDKHAHHLKKFHIILKEIRNSYPLFSHTDICEMKSALWDISNGETLCIKCHKGKR